MDFSLILNIISTHNYDDDRNKSLTSLIGSTVITSSDVPKLAALYVYDHHRNNALKIITKVIKNISSHDFLTTALIYTYDIDRNGALRILLDYLTEITSYDLHKLMECYTYDSNRNIALSLLKSCTCTINSIDFIAIVNTYHYDSDRAEGIKFLSSKCKEDECVIITPNAQNIEQNKLNVLTFLGSFGSNTEDLSLSMLEKNIMHLDLMNVNSICKHLSKFFKVIDNFRKATQILGIDPDIVDLVEMEIEEEIKNKLENNAYISIEGQLYSKDTFKIGKDTRITCRDLIVNICLTNHEKFMICAQRGSNRSSCSANLDDMIIIQKSNFIVGTSINMGKVIINI